MREIWNKPHKIEHKLSSKKVLLFYWNGTPRFIVELDRPIKSITYDKKRNMVLCLGLNNDLEYAVFGFPVDV